MQQREDPAAVLPHAHASLNSRSHSPTLPACLPARSLLAVMHPLGLGASRLAAVRSIAHGFLATDWQEPSQFHGCGKFVSGRWRAVVGLQWCRAVQEWRGRLGGGHCAVHPRAAHGNRSDIGHMHLGTAHPCSSNIHSHVSPSCLPLSPSFLKTPTTSSAAASAAQLGWRTKTCCATCAGGSLAAQKTRWTRSGGSGRQRPSASGRCLPRRARCGRGEARRPRRRASGA